jgi:hypothetical protein
MKPTLKAPGIKLLKVKYDKRLSKPAFKFNLRRYTQLHDEASFAVTLARRLAAMVTGRDQVAAVAGTCIYIIHFYNVHRAPWRLTR